MAERHCRVLVLDMQPISPPVGGGRLRLLGLYHALGSNIPTTYFGTYDWPGEPYRRHLLSPSLEEITVPLSDAHFAEARAWQARVGGRTVIDTSFPQLAHLSPDYAQAVRQAVPLADVVIFSHPWVFPLVRDLLDRDRQLVIYDSHNVEGYLRATLLDDGAFGSSIVREVVRLECELCRCSDLVLVCSHEDLDHFARLYDAPAERFRVIPNGVFVTRLTPAAPETKTRIKRELGLPENPTGIFIGSCYQPNVDAANFLAFDLAPHLPEVNVVIAGGVGTQELESRIKAEALGNVFVTGRISDDAKLRYLQAADFALNPMSEGSGTNIKMFDYMAAGLACLTTAVGARGIEWFNGDPMVVCEKAAFHTAVRRLIESPELLRNLGESARALALENYSFERISAELGRMIARHQGSAGRTPPCFSVIVPSYERHELLLTLCKSLQDQICKDFEVIIVDQSEAAWNWKNENFGLDLAYIHTDVRGAARARNLGAQLARGRILAFTDDDCIPERTWLSNALKYFDTESIVGLEGLVRSEHLDPEAFRTVTNEFSEFQGYLTANLMIRARTFHAIGGFDRRFDNPHFREDTDIGWRASELGSIPFARDVVVYHPPHRRDIARESISTRNRFFEKDPLLFKKHPEKAICLFRQEGHYLKQEYWDAVQRGCRKYNVDYLSFRSLLESVSPVY